MASTIDVSPSVLNLILYAGDGISFNMLFKDGDDAPLNITGSVEADIRIKREDDDPIVEFAVDLTEGGDGVVKLSLTGAQTQALSDDNSAKNGKFSGVWDVQWTAAGMEPRTICQGTVGCELDVTR